MDKIEFWAVWLFGFATACFVAMIMLLIMQNFTK
jgi:hypothetical protein